jgi:PITH domain
MRAFVNRADVDFALAAELPPAGSWTLAEDAEASLEYPTRGRAFAVVSSVTLYFPANGGAPTQQLCFVGLRGTGDASVSRELASNIVYETAPQPADHKVGAFGGMEARLGQ